MTADFPTRAGSALIEALLSLVLLGTVGTSLLMTLGQARETLRSTSASEATIDSASAELERMVPFDRTALADHIGWTVGHGFAVHVEQRSRVLFDVAVSREPGRPPLLATSLYRPDSADAR
jgi:hypothetical protein